MAEQDRDRGAGRDGQRPGGAGAIGGKPAREGDGSLAGSLLGIEVERVQALEDELDRVRAELDRRDAALRQIRERTERKAQEVERTKGRLERDAEQEVERRLRAVLLGFVDVLDDCERALGAAQELEHNPEVLVGTEMVHRRLIGVLEGAGVQRQRSLGERFDPALYEAMSVEPVGDPALDGKVVAVAREGYTIRGQLLRPARVIVGKYLPARSTGPLER